MFVRYMELRFSGNYKIGFFNRLFRYPLFAIIILDCEDYNEEEKEKFRQEVLYPYLISREYRKNFNEKLVVFVDGKFRGVFTRKDKHNGYYVIEYYKEFPCQFKTVYNSERFWFLH